MIRMTKEAKPDILQRKEIEWRDSILQKLNTGQKLTRADKSRYSHRDIKETLVKETNGKCCYCESKIRHITYGDIEHICPKSENPELWVEWSNLTLACDVCNTNKGTLNVTNDNFIDPYAVDPEKKFWFAGPMIIPMLGDTAATICEQRLQLNRQELVSQRIVKFKSLVKHLQLIESAQNDDLKQLLIDDLKREAEDKQEYAALARGFLKIALSMI